MVKLGNGVLTLETLNAGFDGTEKKLTILKRRIG